LVPGGAQQVCYELFEGLREAGEVRPVLLASVDSSYPALFKSGACITGFDGRKDEFLYLPHEYDYWWHRTNDLRRIDAFAEFLLQIKPDVVHFHHFLTYGVEFLTLTRKVLPDARIVFTFHEFLSICANNGHMVRKTDGSLCRAESQVRCHQCFPDRPPEDFFLRKMWMQRHLEAVDVFTCPSKFMMEHYANWGIPREKMVHVSNGQRDYGQSVARGQGAGAKRNRFGFFGQLVDAKGVQVILDAVDILRAEKFTDLKVEINGDNARYASEEVRQRFEACKKAEAEREPEDRIVSFNGGYKVANLRSRMARVDWCIVPSVWWEIFALVISEAWMFGKPVICSNVGAMAERVTDEVDGLHFEMGDAASLARAMKRAATEKGLWAKLVSQLPSPPARSAMVEGFAAVYMSQAFCGSQLLRGDRMRNGSPADAAREKAAIGDAASLARTLKHTAKNKNL
jgi:glycosyltransferase involved in cell wall biosynthesis